MMDHHAIELYLHEFNDFDELIVLPVKRSGHDNELHPAVRTPVERY